VSSEKTSESAPVHAVVSRRIRDWFQGEKQNHGWKRSLEISGEIDAMIAAMPDPLPESAAAWKRWNDFENDTSRVDPGLHIAMDLCKYAEWCADVDLGLTDKPFEGVPRLVISFG
jgi:hypothetical protein